MSPSYYCIRCCKFVLTTMGHFHHPHRGEESCLICYRCGSPVFPKEQVRS